jgi:DNA polymerase III delta' subunit
MSFDSIIGQPLAVDLCRTWLKRQTTNPLLMYGPEGVGKKTLALVTAKALNCQPPSPLTLSLQGEGGRRPGEGRPCGTCLSCRKISAGNHPDVRVIDLAWQAAERKELLEKQQNLRIETIQAERHRLLQSAVEGQWKVSILEDAHRLTADAANVLLKILEEPPARTAIFLLTPFRDRLFATIVSRCQPIRFRSLTDDEMMQCLNRLKVPTDMQVSLAEMALGSPGRALHLSRGEQIEAVRVAEQLWQSLEKESPSRIMHESGGRPKPQKPNRTEIESQIQSLLVPASRALRGGDTGAIAPVRLIQSALTQLRQNVQPGLVLDNLLLQLARKR